MIFRPYRAILARPGAWQFSAAGFISRLPIAMVGIGIVLMVSELYGSYATAGRVSAAYIVTHAICSPQLAKLVDRHGQAKIMRVSITFAAVALGGLIVAAIIRAPEPALYLTAAAAGATIGSMGAMVRARWARVVTTPAELHTAYALESALDELSFVTGPVIATMLATGVTPWAALLVPMAAALIGGHWLLSQRRTEPPPSGREHRAASHGPVLSPAILAVMAIFFATGAVFGGADVVVVAFTEEQGAKNLAGLVLGAFAGGSLIAGLAYGARAWHSPLWLRFVIGAGLLGVGSFAFLLADSVLSLAVIGLIVGCAIAPTLINGNAIVQAKVPAARLTEGLTWLGAGIGVGVSGGAFLAGTVVDAYGARAGFYVVAGAASLAAVIAVVAIRVLREPGPDEPITLPDQNAPEMR